MISSPQPLGRNKLLMTSSPLLLGRTEIAQHSTRLSQKLKIEKFLNDIS
jgi:hypothetical protein